MASLLHKIFPSHTQRTTEKLNKLVHKRLADSVPSSPATLAPPGALPDPSASSDSISIHTTQTAASPSTLIGRILGKDGVAHDDKKIEQDYKKLIQILTDPKPETWRSFAGNIDPKFAFQRLEETSRAPHSDKLKRLSYDLIFRLVVMGIIKFDDQEVQGNGVFIKGIADFLATNYPAALLLSMIRTENHNETDIFFQQVRAQWPESGLPKVIRNGYYLFHKLAPLRLQMFVNVKLFTQYILKYISDEDEVTDALVFTGLFPWMFFKLAPGGDPSPDTPNAPTPWRTNDLSIDERYLDLVKGLFHDIQHRGLILKILYHYVTAHADDNELLHVLIPLYFMKLFNMKIDEMPNAATQEPNPRESFKTALQTYFQPSYRGLTTFYVATHGNFVLTTLMEYVGEIEGARLIAQSAALNIHSWQSNGRIKTNSILEYGIVRTLFLSIKVCGTGPLYETVKYKNEYGKEKENKLLSGLIYHMGNYFKETKPDDPFIQARPKPSSAEVSPTTTSTEDSSTIAASLDSLPPSDELTPLNMPSFDTPLEKLMSTIPESFEVDAERWSWKLGMARVILERLINDAPTEPRKEIKAVFGQLRAEKREEEGPHGCHLHYLMGLADPSGKGKA